MADFNLAALALMQATGGGLAEYGKRTRKRHDAGEDYFLSLSTNKYFKQRPGTNYKQGMTKIQVRKLFTEEANSGDDDTVLNQWERKMLENVFKGDDPYRKIPQDAEISQRIIGYITQTRGQDVTSENARLMRDLRLKLEGNKVLKQLINWGINDEAGLTKAMKDKRFIPVIEDFAAEAGLRVEDMDKPGVFYDLMRSIGLEQKIPGFVSDTTPTTIKEAAEKAQSVEEFLQLARDMGKIKKEGSKDQMRKFANDIGKQFGAKWAKTAAPGVAGSPVEQGIARDLQGQTPVDEQIGSGAPETPIATGAEDPNQQGIGGQAGDAAGLKKIRKYKALMLALKAKRGLNKKVFAGNSKLNLSTSNLFKQ